MTIGTGISFIDIINSSITSVVDNYDGNIALSSITITVFDGSTPISEPIQIPDTYTANYSVSDSSGNIATATKTLIASL